MRTKKQLIACGLSIALLLGMIPNTEVSAAKKVSLSTKKLTVTKGKSKTLKVKNAKKKVTWKILSGKQCITLKKKGKAAAAIKGKKKGTAKVQAAIGKTKLTCKVTVKNKTKQNTTKPATAKTPVSSANTQPTATSTPTNTQTPSSESDTPQEKNAQDVAVLKALIAEQREREAMVCEDLDSDEYTWENGRLIGLHWGVRNLSGSLDLTGLSALTFLDCGVNKLSSLDVSSNIALTKLYCSENKLSSLDISKNAALTILSCYYNELSSLDVSKNTALTNLGCSNNQLRSLDVSKNTALDLFLFDETVTVIGDNRK